MNCRIVVTAFAVTSLLAGCGFTPKKPPEPDDGVRIAINQRPPDPRPWALANAITPQAKAPAASPNTQPVSTTELIAKPDADANPLEATAETGNTPRVAPEQEPDVIERQIADDTRLTAQVDKPKPAWISATLHGMGELAVRHPVVALSSITLAAADNAQEPQTQQSTTTPAQQPAAKPSAESSSPTPQSPTADVNNATTLAVDQPTPIPQRDLPSAQNADQRPDLKPAKPDEAAQSPLPSEPGHDIHVATTQVAEPVASKPSADKASTPSEQPPDAQPAKEPDAALLPSWTASRGMTLSDVLREWGAKADWMVLWETRLDYRIEADFAISASDYLGAVNKLLSAYREAGLLFSARAYANHVLLVTVPTE